MLKDFLLKMLSCAAAFMALLPLQAQMYTNTYSDPSCTCKNRFWLEADYLYWQLEDSPRTIPLVISQPIENGAFEVILGGKKIKDDWHSGAKFTLGYWFDESQSLGAEVNFFFLEKESERFRVASNANGSPRLRVPYFNVNTNLPDSSALATPGVFRGEASLKMFNQMLGSELNCLKEIPLSSTSIFKLLAGFRYWKFEDGLTFSANSPLVSPVTVYKYRDKFFTQSNFYGGQLGAYFKHDFSCFFFDVKGKIALGAMCQKSTIKGRFKTDEFTGEVQAFEGGFFALPTNIGRHKGTRFSVIPELNSNIGYNITDNFCIRVGYSILYASKILRANQQIDNRINPTQSANIEFTPTPVLVGEARPKARLKSNELWVQGLNVGLDFTF